MKKGDKVRCIRSTHSSGNLYLGGIYTIDGYFRLDYEDKISVEEMKHRWLKSRFELVVEEDYEIF